MTQQSGKPRNTEAISKAIFARLKKRFNIGFSNVRQAISDIENMVVKEKLSELDVIGDELLNNFVYSLVRFYFPDASGRVHAILENVLKSNVFLNKKYDKLGLYKIINYTIIRKENRIRKFKTKASIIEFIVGLIIRNASEDSAIDFLQDQIYTLNESQIVSLKKLAEEILQKEHITKADIQEIRSLAL